MQFSIVSILALALGAAAQVATVEGVLSDVQKQVKQVDSLVTSFGTDPTALSSASAQLLTTIQSGTTTVSNSAPLSLQDATQVSGSSVALNTSTATLIQDLIAKKQAIVAAGAGPAVLKSLQDQAVASAALANAITSKVPTALQSTAQLLSQGVNDSIARGIAAYQGVGPAPSSSAMPPGMSMPSSAPTGTGNSTAVSPSSPKPTATPTTAPKPNSAVTNGVNGLLAALAVVLAF